jgi:hypothetical protein
MTSTYRRQFSPSDLGAYLTTKGLMHDCSVSLRHMSGERFELLVRDVNSSFKGLQEYEGFTSCLIELHGVRDVQMDANYAECKVFEASAASSEGTTDGELLVTFWPRGSLRLKFETVHVTEGNLSSTRTDE